MNSECRVKKVERLGDFVRVRTGKLDANASSMDGEYPFFTCSEEPLRIASFSYDCECVLVAGNGDLNVKYYSGKFDAYQRTYIIESTNHQALDVRYLFHFMSVYVEQLRAMSVGGVIKYIKLGYLTDAKIPLPPLAEQRRIAEVLDRAEALRVKRRAALAQLDSLTQSLFLDLFGDPTKKEKNWPLVRLDELATVERGKFTPRPRNDPSYYGGQFPFIQTGDISDSKGRVTSWTQTLNEKGIAVSRSFRAGTVVIAIVGATLGMTAILDVEVYCPDSVVGLQARPSIATAEYIERVLRFWRPIFVAQAPETARANINLETLRPLQVPAPPLPLQREFTRRVQAVEKLKTVQRASLAELDALFATLQHRAFRGEL